MDEDTELRSIIDNKTTFVPLCVPSMIGNEWAYIKECIDTNWISSVGSYVTKFEEMMGKVVDGTIAVAAINGTAALHISLLIAGVQPDDEVLVSTLTFIAPANTIRYVGAWPVFIDAEPHYWQMDPDKALDFLNHGCSWQDGALRNKATGRRVKAIIPVHILGHPVDMDPLLNAARKYGLAVIEDATESLGAKYKGRPVGHQGDIACFSFNGNKLITTGGGGMIVTDKKAWADRARYLTTQAKDDEIEFVHNEIGYNYRLTNVQAAMGCAQIEHLSDYITAKRKIAQIYDAALGGVRGIERMREAPWAFSTYWMYTVLIDKVAYGMSSRELLNLLQAARIQTRPLWQPMHMSPAHRGAFATDCSVAERLNRDALSLPCSVSLNNEDQGRVISHILRSMA